MDIRLSSGTKAGCTVEGGLTIVPLFIGVGPASVEHAQVPGLLTHLYVLANGKSNIILEASDVSTDAEAFEFKQVISSFDFAAASGFQARESHRIEVPFLRPGAGSGRSSGSASSDGCRAGPARWFPIAR